MHFTPIEAIHLGYDTVDNYAKVSQPDLGANRKSQVGERRLFIPLVLL
jgi:hypothetical protein